MASTYEQMLDRVVIGQVFCREYDGYVITYEIVAADDQRVTYVATFHNREWVGEMQEYDLDVFAFFYLMDRDQVDLPVAGHELIAA